MSFIMMIDDIVIHGVTCTLNTN